MQLRRKCKSVVNMKCERMQEITVAVLGFGIGEVTVSGEDASLLTVWPQVCRCHVCCPRHACIRSRGLRVPRKCLPHSLAATRWRWVLDASVRNGRANCADGRAL